MKICLSKNHIESFCGNVLPLRLLGVEEFGMEDITWRLEGECLDLKTFDGPAFNQADDGGFTDGVLLTFLFPGEAKVIATYQGKEYVCHVVSREMKKASSDDELEYFVGDMHVHSARVCGKLGSAYSGGHRGALIDRIDGSSPDHTVEEFRKDGRIDFHVISDHAGLLNRKEFYRGFLAEELSGDNMITFAGSEGQNYSFERDKYGLICDNTNEIVCINASTHISAGFYREFLDGLVKSPFVIGTLAHPHALGAATGGKGDFRLYKNCTPRFRQIVKYVETGDGTDRSGNLANELMYSVALDNGFRVSTTCSSDSHGPVWGYDRFPGKTILMAREKSREAFLDALMEIRAYACMSGNVKLRYSVNGHTAPSDLPMAKTYKFHLQTSYFKDIPDTKIIKGEVISNGGVTVKELEGDFSDMTFEIFSDTASWFYLRLWDEEGRKTWSVPVFTGRAPYQTHNDDLEPLSKFGVTVLDERTGESASQVMCDDPFRYWKAKETSASLLIDLKKEELITGVGHYARVLYGKFMAQTGVAKERIPIFWCGCPFGYRVSTSVDGENYTVCAEGVLRTVSGEEIIRFQKRMARYIRLEILSTVGTNSHRKGFEDAPVVLGELTVYRKNEKTDMRAVMADRMERYGNHFLQRTDPEVF